MISSDFYLDIFIIAVIVMTILGIFKRSLFNRLSIRIAVLILASGSITLILIPVSNELIRVPRISPLVALTVYVLIALGTPIVLGLLATRFVRRPLGQFKEAIASLEQSNYKVELQSMNIREFDEVFTKFNNLIHRLQHEEKLRKNLISDTSHELNAPLATMIGQLTAMQEGKYPLREDRVTILKEQAERLAELVQQLDAYTKARMPDTGEPEDIHLRQFCEELFWRSLAFVCIFSLTVEILQFVFAIGVTDITDVITNTSGGFLGLILYAFSHKYVASEKLDRLIVVTGISLLIFVILLLGVLFSHGVRYQKALPISFIA